MPVFKKIIPVFIFLFLCMQQLKAVTWITVGSGNWTAGNIWQGGIAPSASSADTFIIKHAVFITGNLTFNAHALLKIDSTGGICGHYKMTVYSGAEVIKYGTLDLDTLAIPGGVVNCYLPGSVILSIYGILTVSGAQLNTYGCSFTVGPWFTCGFDNDAGIDPVKESEFSLFPNPSNGKFTVSGISGSIQDALIEIYDLAGILVFRSKMQAANYLAGREISYEADAGNLAPGIYTLHINQEKNLLSKKLVIVK